MAIAVIGLVTLAPGARASVDPRAAFLEDGTLQEFDQVNTLAGELTNSRRHSYEGARSAQAVFRGGAEASGYQRGLFETDWRTGEDVHYGAAFFLPERFKGAMQGQVDLMRWDNWSLDPENTDRSGIVIYGSDNQARLVRARIGDHTEQVPLVGPFDIPRGRWVWIEVHQHLSPIDGEAFSEVWVDGRKVGSSHRANSYGRPATRIRYGIVATDPAQSKALKLWFDRAMIGSGRIGAGTGS